MGASRVSLIAVALMVFGALAASFGTPANASESYGSAGRERGIVLADAGISMDQAVKMVEERFRARVVRAETQREDGRTVYVLRLLNDSGRVWTVRVDAASGSIL